MSTSHRVPVIVEVEEAAMARRYRDDVEDNRKHQPHTESRGDWCQEALTAGEAPHDLGEREREETECAYTYDGQHPGSGALAVRITMAIMSIRATWLSVIRRRHRGHFLGNRELSYSDRTMNELHSQSVCPRICSTLASSPVVVGAGHD